MALSFGKYFYQNLFYNSLMNFVKRDLILLAGVFLLMIGLIPFILPIYSILISIAIFFGIKAFVHNRQKYLKKKIGEGFCAKCSGKIINKKCPNCDKSEKT